MNTKQSDETMLAVISNDIAYIKKDVGEIKLQMVESYVTKSDFEPVKRIVYGLVGLILTSVVIGLLALVLKGGPK